MVKYFVDGIINRAIKNVTLRHCIQYADDKEKGNTITCRRLEFENFHDYKRYTPDRCNKDMVNFFVKRVGSNNKSKSTNQIINRMKKGTCESPYVFNKTDSNKKIGKSNIIKLKKQQKLVPRIINPQTNLKGLLVYHGLGSGKTGTSIIVGEACKHIMTNMTNISKGSNRSKGRVLVVGPASLVDQYKNEILGKIGFKKSGVTQEELKEKLLEYLQKNNDINSDNYIDLKKYDKKKFMTCVQMKLNDNKKYPRYNNSFSSNVEIDGIKQSYRSIKDIGTSSHHIVEKTLLPKRLEKVNKVFKVISRQSFMKHFLYRNERFINGEIKDIVGTGKYIRNYLKEPNGLLIIDEIQNLISESGSWYKNLLKGIKYFCHPTTRILLLTATPIYDKTFELGLTINLLNPRIRFPEKRVDFEKLFVATSSIELEDEKKRNPSGDINDRINLFMTRENRIKKFNRIQNPEQDIDDTNNETTMLYDKLQNAYIKLSKVLNKIPIHITNIPITSEIEDCLNVYSKKFLEKFKNKNMNKIVYAPISRKELFNILESYKKLLFLNEYRNSTIKNRDMFEYMCSGYISYFKGGNPKGFPKKITKIIDCKMKGAQANTYQSIVDMEVKKNTEAEASRQLNPNSTKQGTYFQKACMYSNVLLTYTKKSEISRNEIQEMRKSLIDLIKNKGIPLTEDMLDKIKNMDILSLQELQEKTDTDSIHDAIIDKSEEEKTSQMIENIEKITSEGNKNHVKTMIKLTAQKNKRYYEATLKVIREKLLKIRTNKERLDEIDINYSCKFAKMINKIIEPENGEGKHFVYSRFKTRGVECLSYMLESFGYKRYDEEKINKLKDDVDNKVELEGKCFTVWSGDIMDKVEFSKNFKSIYNNEDNRNGKYLKLVLGTESIMEGVDLKEVKYVHITEPWWNESRMDQVMGRAIRWKSHINMELDDRKVIIYRYYALCDLDSSRFRKNNKDTLMSNEQSIDLVEHSLDGYNEHERRILREDLDFAIHKLENKDPISPLQFSSIDRYIQTVAEKKKRLNQMFYKSIKNSAIDCLFNKYGNTYKLEEEIYYKNNDDKNPPVKYYYDPTEHKYYDTDFREVIKEISRNDLFYTNKYENDDKKNNKKSIEELEKRKVDRINDIFVENIECNFSNKTGIQFVKVLESKGMKQLLNSVKNNKLNEILFNEVVYKTQEEQEEIKRRFKECLKSDKITKNFPEKKLIWIDNINKIFNTMSETSLKTKIINNIISVLVEYQFQQWKDDNEFSTVSEDSVKRVTLQKEAEKIQTLLYNQPMDYLKQTEMMFKIDSIADEVYVNLIKNIKTKYVQKKPNRGRRRGTFRKEKTKKGLNDRDFLMGLDTATTQDDVTAIKEAEKRNNKKK